jgi:hypothetical protein
MNWVSENDCLSATSFSWWNLSNERNVFQPALAGLLDKVFQSPAKAG